MNAILLSKLLFAKLKNKKQVSRKMEHYIQEKFFILETYIFYYKSFLLEQFLFHFLKGKGTHTLLLRVL